MRTNYIKWIAFLLLSLPVSLGSLGALSHTDPYDQLLHVTGEYGLIAFIVMLAFGPLLRLTKQRKWLYLKQPIGLSVAYHFFLHILGYFMLHAEPFLGALSGIVSSAFLWPGVASAVILTALALTSYKAAVRLLKRRWALLHSGMVWAAALGAVHAITAQKIVFNEFGLLVLIIFGLLILRVVEAFAKRGQ